MYVIELRSVRFKNIASLLQDVQFYTGPMTLIGRDNW